MNHTKRGTITKAHSDTRVRACVYDLTSLHLEPIRVVWIEHIQLNKSTQGTSGSDSLLGNLSLAAENLQSHRHKMVGKFDDWGWIR